MNAADRIRELVRANLLGRRIDVVRFVDELLHVAADVGEIRGSLAGNDALRFETPRQPAWEVEVDRAKGKLRMCCARLGVLCNESGGREVSLYGDEGVIVRAALNGATLSRLAAIQVGASVVPGAAPHGSPAGPEKWAVRFKNTPSEQEFVIQTQ